MMITTTDGGGGDGIVFWIAPSRIAQSAWALEFKAAMFPVSENNGDDTW